MNNPDENRKIWRDELGDEADTVWDAFAIRQPPAMDPIRRERRSSPWMRYGLAASWVAIVVLFAWNVDLQGEVSAAREQTALVLLAADRSDRVLAGLDSARRLGRDSSIRAALLELLRNSDDPNVQLEALDLLLDDVLSDPERRRQVVEQIRFNREFIELALQAREVRT